MGREISSLRIRRLLRLLAYLRKKGESGAEVSDVLNHCEYSGRRALQDDIRLLRDEYRAEIIYKRSRPPRYCLIDAGELLFSLRLDINEIGALSMGLGMAMHFIPFIKDSCKRLWQKVAELAPQSMLNMGEWLAGAVTMEVPVSGIKPLVFEIVIEAVHEHQVLEIEYVSPYKDRQAKTHIISPYDIFFKAHSWYMTAGCDERVLMFKLSRIRKVRVLDDVEFSPPPEDYNAENFKASSWYVKGGELKHSMRLEIREPMATIVSETMKHPTQRIWRIDSETVELTAAIPDLDEAARWILSCSPSVKVIEPEELREKVCALAEKVISANSTTENRASSV
ncbi:MAG: WYL domain-containing protein [Synergistaceae bacterium]|nr:WYL domain-containing protein [Synergistaceae bacterium]